MSTLRDNTKLCPFDTKCILKRAFQASKSIPLQFPDRFS